MRGAHCSQRVPAGACWWTTAGFMDYSFVGGTMLLMCTSSCEAKGRFCSHHINVYTFRSNG